MSADAVRRRSDSLRANGTRRKLPRIVEGVAHWKCCTCGEWKVAGEFYADDRTSNGLKAQCRGCHSQTSIASRDADRHRAGKRIHEANRRARIAGAPGVLTPSILARLTGILGSACLACGATGDVQWDHIVPIARGGVNRPGNLQPLCRRCNEKKQARTVDYRTDEQRAAIAKVWVLEFRRLDA